MTSLHRARVLALYRNLLATHKRKLPGELRFLGDAYVREEFQKHKQAHPHEVRVFLQQWHMYLQQLRKTRDLDSLGRALPADEVGSLNANQRKQLERLREEATAPPSSAGDGRNLTG